MTKQIKLSQEELERFKIGSQQDMDKLQAIMSQHAGVEVQLAPFEGVSADVQAYLAAKGQTVNAAVNVPPMQRESVLTPEDIQNYIKTLKK